MYQPADILKLPEGTAIVLNSGHKNAKEAAVPFRHRFTYTQKDEVIAERSQALWHKECHPRLIQRAPGLSTDIDTLIKERRNEAKRILKGTDPETSRGGKDKK